MNLPGACGGGPGICEVPVVEWVGWLTRSRQPLPRGLRGETHTFTQTAAMEQLRKELMQYMMRSRWASAGVEDPVERVPIKYTRTDGVVVQAREGYFEMGFFVSAHALPLTVRYDTEYPNGKPAVRTSRLAGALDVQEEGNAHGDEHEHRTCRARVKRSATLCST